MKQFINFKSKEIHSKIIVCLIAVLALLFRSYNTNWDSGYHMHPDERAIAMYAAPLNLPASFSEFLSVTSPLNPHFFAYGNLPLYLVKAVSLLASYSNPLFTTYEDINLVGRYMSLLFELGTIATLFVIAKKIFSRRVGLIAAFLYSVSVFPIQNAHFYTVDAMLTFLILQTLYQLICFYFNPSRKRATSIGILFGLALATKDSALVLLAAIGMTIAVDFLIIFIKQPHKPKTYFPHIPIFLKRLFSEGVIIIITASITFAICEPYAIIDSSEFWQQTMQQSAMTKDAFVFPYTLQYVGKTPYLYELKNIFYWGFGPLIALVTFMGIVYSTWIVVKKHTEKKHIAFGLLLVFFYAYFFVVGKFHVGFMRYMLPEYPLFCLAGGLFLATILKTVQKHSMTAYRILVVLFFLSCLLYPLAFIHIYSQPNTRIQATNWILHNIKPESTIAIEHWDDALPLTNQQQYQTLTLALYDPDTPQKWEIIHNELKQTNYIILASNRLYVPLQKLTDCAHLPPFKCYPQTAAYYKKLFDGSLGFKKVAEFAIYPTIPILNISINDQSADESFTVYDHPKVMIFEKEDNKKLEKFFDHT